MGIVRRIKSMLYVMLLLSVALSACKINNTQNIVSDTSTEPILTSPSKETEAVESTTEKIRDNVTMNFDLDEVLVNGNKIDSCDDTDYDLSNLISVSAYEQTGAKLYAYEGTDETGDGYTYTNLKLLLEHDGCYQVFAKNEFVDFINMFGYGTEEDHRSRDFDEGYEYDLDNDGELELVIFVVTDYGSEFLGTDIVVFDYNKEAGEYEAYHTGIDYFGNLGNQAIEAFFDEYYGPYTIDERGRYDFGNGYHASFFDHVDSYINEDGDIEMTVIMVSTHKEDSGTFWIGEMVFDIDYLGNGRFSVKTDRYVEWNNLMDPNLVEDYI